MFVIGAGGVQDCDEQAKYLQEIARNHINFSNKKILPILFERWEIVESFGNSSVTVYRVLL